MNPRKGRPKSDNPKSESVHLRLTTEDKEILDAYCLQENVVRAKAIRIGIRKLRDEIQK